MGINIKAYTYRDIDNKQLIHIKNYINHKYNKDLYISTIIDDGITYTTKLSNRQKFTLDLKSRMEPNNINVIYIKHWSSISSLGKDKILSDIKKINVNTNNKYNIKKFSIRELQGFTKNTPIWQKNPHLLGILQEYKEYTISEKISVAYNDNLCNISGGKIKRKDIIKAINYYKGIEGKDYLPSEDVNRDKRIFPKVEFIYLRRDISNLQYNYICNYLHKIKERSLSDISRMHIIRDNSDFVLNNSKRWADIKSRISPLLKEKHNNIIYLYDYQCLSTNHSSFDIKKYFLWEFTKKYKIQFNSIGEIISSEYQISLERAYLEPLINANLGLANRLEIIYNKAKELGLINKKGAIYSKEELEIIINKKELEKARNNKEIKSLI